MVDQTKINCRFPWLDQAIILHELHMKDSSTATPKSQQELMNLMINARKCVRKCTYS